MATSPLRYGRWVVESQLGEGGGATVFRAIDSAVWDRDELANDVVRRVKSLSRAGAPPDEDRADALRLAEVLRSLSAPPQEAIGALKVPHHTEDASERERLKREVDALRSINHPHIVKVKDVAPDHEWFVMEILPGGTLDVSRYTGHPGQALRAIRGIVEALAALHKQGFIHRDVKPNNIFLADDGRLVLGDFGIAWHAETDPLTATGYEIISRDWAPPWRRFLPEPKWEACDDVFMVGKVIYAMVSTLPNVDPSQLNVPEFDLASIFPRRSDVLSLNALLAKCIVVRAQDCITDAGILLGEIDACLAEITSHELSQISRREK